MNEVSFPFGPQRSKVPSCTPEKERGRLKIGSQRHEPNWENQKYIDVSKSQKNVRLDGTIILFYSSIDKM